MKESRIAMARTVFITGGTGSVGQALVQHFSSAGYRVIFQFKSNSVRADALKIQTGAVPFQFDFQTGVLPELENIDILINNAAINISRSPTVDVTNDDWNLNLLVNLTWPFLLTKLVLPAMIKNKWGRIINISSIFGLRGCEGNLPYNVSKHGLSALTKTVAREYASSGISANEICPGPIESELLDRIARYHEKNEAISRDIYLASLANDIPMGRLATPGDVAHVAVFLASEQATYVNGVSIPVDGGLIS